MISRRIPPKIQKSSYQSKTVNRIKHRLVNDNKKDLRRVTKAADENLKSYRRENKSSSGNNRGTKIKV